MPEKESQKVDESKSFGGNSSHGRPKSAGTKRRGGEATSARQLRPPTTTGIAKATAASKIPVPKNRRAPFKHVQSSSSSEAAAKKTSSSSKQIPSKGTENAITMATATTDTRVKKVPDFRKLHSKWSKKMEKAKKENRSAISVQEFPITPHGKFTPNKPHPRPTTSRKGENPAITSTVPKSTTTSSEQQLSPFKADSASLHNILHGNGEPPPSLSHRATLACGELKIPRDTYRYSMYRRRPAVAPSAPSAKSPGLFASVSHAQGRELLTRLAGTTLNSIRTVSKVNHDDTSDNTEFSSVKKSLKFSAEDECGSKPNNSLNNFANSLDSTLNITQLSSYSKRDFNRERAPELVPKDQFYVLEPELCHLLKSGDGEGGGVAKHCIGGRGQCPSPVARLLDNVYFVPINNNNY